MPAGPLLVGAEGVILRRHKSHYGSSQPIMEGLELVTVLKYFPTSRLVVHCFTEDMEAADFFVKINGLRQAQVLGIKPEEKTLEPALAQWRCVQRVRAQGPINLVLTAYRMVYVHCVKSHQPVLLYGRRGSVGSPEGAAPWDALQQSIQQQREAKVEAIGDEE